MKTLVFYRNVILIFLALAAWMFAQNPAPIAGRITDSKGLPIPAAMVRALAAGRETPAVALTDLDGAFAFQDLPAGVYQLTIEIVGFQKGSKDAVDASSAEARNLTIKLEALPRPPRPNVVPQASAQQPQPAATFQEAEVAVLPGIEQFQLQSTATGTASTSNANSDSLLLISGNSASLDAGDYNDPGFRQQMTDAARQMGYQLQEFSSGAESGRGAGDAGGGRGGGAGFAPMGGRGVGSQQSKIQGTASETFSNSALNARDYSLTGQTLSKPVHIQNNYSLTLGGVLPLFKSSSTSQAGNRSSGRGGGGGRGSGQPGWSFTYSGNRNRSAQNVLMTVPTDLERTGEFSQTYTQASVTDSATGQSATIVQPVRLYARAGDSASQFTKINSIDPVAAQLLSYIPRSNIACASGSPCVNNYARQRSVPSSTDQIQASITGLRVTPKDNLGVNYSLRRGTSLNAATFPGFDSNRTNFAQNIGISGTHSFKQRLSGNWRVTLNRTRTEGTNAFAYQQNVIGTLGITGVSQEPINWGPPNINFTNYGDLSLSAPSLSRNQTFSLSGGMNKIGNKHSLQMGGDISWAQRDSRSDSNARGSFSFTGYATVLLDALGRQVSGTGNDFADFLLGFPYSTSRRYVDPASNPYGNGLYLRNRSWNLYIMDNWRYGANLTLNIGLRYEYTGPTFELHNLLVSLDAAPGFASVAQVFPNQTGPLSGQKFSRSLVNPDRNNFAPRIGIAWKPSSRSRFVIRTGYGIGYNAGGYSSIVNQLVNQPPFAVTQNLASDRANPLTLQTGFPTDPTVTILNTYAIDPNYRPAYAQQWNFNIQTQLAQVYALNVGYSGARGTGLDILRAPNRSSGAGNFVYQTNGANSIYHGLSLQLQRRFSRGFNLTNSYTLSKSIDDSSGSGSSVAQNDGNLAAERSLTSQDQRHNFQSSFTLDLPMGQNRMFFAGASTKVLNLVSGWTLNGNLTIASGSPASARYASSGGSSSGAALYNSLRPDVTGEPVKLARSNRTIKKFFNTSAFAIPSGTYGNAGRNTISGPGSISLNLSVQKNFSLGESGRRLNFSWQVQNLLNHPNWSGVGTTINALNFGQVTGVRSMRSMTANLRLSF